MSLPASPPIQTTCEPVDVTLKDKLAFLENASPWPDEPPPACIEIHASHVFLTRERACKLKKPVRFLHIDQRTLVERPGGGLALDGEGRIIDWLVETVRLFATSMPDRRLKASPVPRLSEIVSPGDVLVSFFRKQPKNADAGRLYYRRLLRESRTNAAHLREMQHHPGCALREDVLDFALPALESCRAEIIARARRGLLSEGHDDLRAEHVRLTDPPVVFDRVEFDHDVRLIDPFAEFNGPGIERAFSGAGWNRAILLIRLSQTTPPSGQALLTAYGVVTCLTPRTAGHRPPVMRRSEPPPSGRHGRGSIRARRRQLIESLGTS